MIEMRGLSRLFLLQLLFCFAVHSVGLALSWDNVDSVAVLDGVWHIKTKDGQELKIASEKIAQTLPDSLLQKKEQTTAEKSVYSPRCQGGILLSEGRFSLGAELTVVDVARQPLHSLFASGRVLMPSFYIDATEVTNSEYAQFVQATGHKPPSHWVKGKVPENAGSLPVVNVSYHDAEAYAQWAGKRLPTEIEWERAAKGSAGFSYPYGAQYHPDFANTEGDGLQPVGSYAAILSYARLPEGSTGAYIANMRGNVSEWTASVFSEQYDVPVDEQGVYNSYKANRSGPFKVVRGGSYRSSAPTATTMYRERMHQDDINAHTGFRCVWDVR